MIDDRHPVVIGVGQITMRDQSWPEIASPMELMAEATTRAEADTGGGILRHVDHLTVVNIFSWDYGDAPALLADGLGLDPRTDRRYLEVGGNTPQRAVNEVSARLAAGELEMAVVVGAEAVAGRRLAKKSGHLVDWGRHPGSLPPPDERDPCHPMEDDRQIALPIVSYPLWEPALRTAAGRTPEQQTEFIGGLMARFTEVAARNPNAWFPERATAEELMTVSGGNRMVSSPYPKRVNAIMAVDQGAALILTTAGRARELGIADDRWVFVLGGGDCYDIWYLTERTTYARSPGMRKVAEQTWASSGLGIDDIAHVDLYSCFPSAVQLAMEAYGIAADDPRPMTVTGGLPYAGGPGNNYTTQSIATMAETLRADPGQVGLCTGLGWHVTKHSAGLYSSAPPTRPYEPIDPAPDQAEIDAAPHPKIEPQPSGNATIEGYSVWYGREGAPEMVRCLARLDPDRRSVVANDDPDTAEAMAEGEWHGRMIELEPGGGFSI